MARGAAARRRRAQRPDQARAALVDGDDRQVEVRDPGDEPAGSEAAPGEGAGGEAAGECGGQQPGGARERRRPEPAQGIARGGDQEALECAHRRPLSSRSIAERVLPNRSEPVRPRPAPGLEPPPAISLEGVSKVFHLPDERVRTIKARLASRLGRGTHRYLHALHEVELEVRKGEFFGIVGRNGSGKSTLLRCIAGIYEIDAGEIEVEDRLSPCVELGVGFNRELTGRENAVVEGVLLGLAPDEARERVEAALAFAELEGFGEVKLKNFSSGMKVRLAFAVAMQVDYDIVLIDEVLAVGDSSFQRRCFEEFERLKSLGRTIVFVSHDMETVRRFCDRALLLDRGRTAELGGPAQVAERYEQLNLGSGRLARMEAGERPEPGAGRDRPRRYAPSAFGDGARRFWTLCRTLAATDFKLHNEGSLVGYLVSVLRPLLMFVVIYLVFTRVTSFSEGVEHYPVYLLTAIMLWNFFTEATTDGVTSLARGESLLRNLRFPRLALPAAATLKALLNLCVNAIPVAVLIAATGVEPRLSWLEMPLLVAALVLLAAGVSMLLSIVYVRFKDVRQAWAAVLQLLFFGSAVLYVITRFPEEVQRWMALNPLAMVFTQMRHALIDPSAPTAADVIGGQAQLLIPVAVVLGTFVAGLWLFRRESPRIAELL